MEPKLKLFVGGTVSIRPSVRDVICPGEPRRASQGHVLVVAANKAAAMAAAERAMRFTEDLKLVRQNDRWPSIDHMFEAGVASITEPIVLAWQATPSTGSHIVAVEPDGTARHVANFRYDSNTPAIVPVEENSNA